MPCPCPCPVLPCPVLSYPVLPPPATVIAALETHACLSNRIVPAEDLVDLLLLVETELTRAAVDQEQETADNGENLEEVVLGEILVGVVLVKLQVGRVSNPPAILKRTPHDASAISANLQSRSC